MPLCKKCGYNTPEDSVFCPRCGTSLQQVETSSDMTEKDWELHAAEFFPRCPLCGSKSLEFDIKYGHDDDCIDCPSCNANWEIDWKGEGYEIKSIRLVEVRDTKKIVLKGRSLLPQFWLKMALEQKGITQLEEVSERGDRMKDKDVRYEEWKKTVNEMGLSVNTEISYEMIIGKYRNQNVTIDEIDLGGGDDPHILKTRYEVYFENPQMILLHIRRHWPHQPTSDSWRGKHVRDIHLDNPQLLQGLVIKGNNENAIKSILDSSICNRIMNIKDSLYQMEIGHGKPYICGNQIEIEVREPNVARYIDSQSLQKTKGNAPKFKSILDTLIDIVEKIETYTPSI